MRFIKYNFLDDSSFAFSLDYLLSIASDKHHTLITLTDGTERILPIHIDNFCVKVFSDEHGENEYQLIEIDEPEPLSDEDMGRLLRHT